jgi:hypothetical protein
MKWYELVKVIHYMGLIPMTAAMIFYPRLGERIRSATTLAEARRWLALLELTPGMFFGGSTMLLLSGLGMIWMRWRVMYAFYVIGLVVLVVIMLGFGSVQVRHLKEMRARIGEGEGPISDDVARLIRKPGPWSMILAMNFAAIGVLFEMTLKLGWMGGIALVVAGAAIGSAVGASTARK